MRRLAALGLALGLVAGASPAAVGRDLAGELRSAQAALADADYLRAYGAFLEHADNNALAQFTLGLFHQYGWGRPIDPAETCRWQEKAAQGGVPAAQQMLADCLRQGIHRAADPAAAAHWYEQATMSGMLMASCSLADLYMAGVGVEKDPRKAIALCRAAADKGIPAGQVHLAELLLEGDAMVRDPGAGLHWMRAAAQAGDGEARYRLALMLRDGVGQPADALAGRQWMEAAASQGWLAAYLPTAELYFNAPPDPETGLLSASDLAKAYLWSAAAARRLSNSPQAEQARALLDKVLARMPPTWRPDLDRRIDAHLAKVGAVPDGLRSTASSDQARASASPSASP